MQHYPYCGSNSLIKNGSTRGVPKWKCKKCGRQTSLKGDKVEKDRQRDQARSEAVLLYLSGLSLKIIAFLKSVVPPRSSDGSASVLRNGQPSRSQIRLG